MNITILTVGSKPKPEINSIIQTYLTRLPKTISVTFQYVKHGGCDTKTSIQRESENILRTLPKTNTIILLDETGKQLSSPELSQMLFASSSDVTFIIGGAYGVSDEVKSRAGTIWSLGKLVYPHQIVRIILSEQIYRSHCINTGHPYHHA